MITAIVRYPLPASIKRADCLAHFHKIAPGFGGIQELIAKQFIWAENGTAERLSMGLHRGRARFLYRPVARRHRRALRRLPEDRIFHDLRGLRRRTGEVDYTEPKVSAKACQPDFTRICARRIADAVRRRVT